MKSATPFQSLILVIPLIWVFTILMLAKQQEQDDGGLVAAQAVEQSLPRQNQDRIIGTTEQEREAFDRFVAHESNFKDHYQANFLASHYEYHQYRPAYQHGFELGLDPRYERSDWTSVEPEARRTWVESTMGMWSQYRDAVRYGWEQGIALERK